MPLSLYIIVAVSYALAGCYILYIVYFLLGFRRLKAPALKEDADLPPLSVLICARNEEAVIETCVRSVFAQDYPGDKFRVLVVNDCSEDRTAQILEKLAAEFPSLKLLHLNSCPKGISPKKHAIARGLEYCDTEFILATDADARHDPQWLRSYASLCNEKLGAATGLSLFRKDEFRSAWERTWQSMQTLEALSHNVVIAGAMMNGFVITANGNNMMYRKSLFNSNTALKNNVVTGDDSDIVYEAQRRGYDVLFNAHPASVVRLEPESGIGAVVNQRVRWASHVMKATLPVRILGLSVFLFYLSTLLLPFLSFADPAVLYWWGGLWLIKAACDFAYMSFTLHKFRIPYNFGHLFLMELVHALFIVLVGLAGTFGRFTWKGTEYQKTMKP